MGIKDLINKYQNDKMVLENSANGELSVNTEPDHIFNIKTDNITQSLMKYLSVAIDEWAKEHQLDGLPKDIVMEQALLAITEAYNTLKKQENK